MEKMLQQEQTVDEKPSRWRQKRRKRERSNVLSLDVAACVPLKVAKLQCLYDWDCGCYF